MMLTVARREYDDSRSTSLGNKPHCHFIIANRSARNSHKSHRTGYPVRHTPELMPVFLNTIIYGNISRRQTLLRITIFLDPRIPFQTIDRSIDMINLRNSNRSFFGLENFSRPISSSRGGQINGPGRLLNQLLMTRTDVREPVLSRIVRAESKKGRERRGERRAVRLDIR